MKGATGAVRACGLSSEHKVSGWNRRLPSFRLPSFRAVLLLLLAILPWFAAHATTYTYDSAGRLKSATNSQGQTATYDYDSRGNILSIERTGSTQLAIASFAPNNGPPGTQVTINGSGFASSTSDNSVTFNGVTAPVLAASATQLLVQVPFNAATGPIGVTVATATVTSDDIFTISTIGDPPVISGFSPITGVPGTTLTITGLHLDPIDGETTATIDGVFSPITSIDDLQVTVQVPPFVGSGQISITTPYGIASTTTPFWVYPVGTDPSTVTQEPTLVAGASAQSANISASTPNAAFLFPGAAGEYVSLQASSFSNTSQSVNYSVYSPLGVVIASGWLSATSPSIHLSRLHETGTFNVFVGSATGSLQFSLSLVVAPAVTINGASLNVLSPVPAQSQRFSFNAIAGENLGLGLSNLSVAGYGTYTGNIGVTVYDPDGASWVFAYCTAPQCDVNLWNVPKSGTYTVVLDSNGQSNETFSSTVTLSDATTLFLPSTNTPTTLNLPRFGQNGIYTFVGTAGQNIALRFTVPSGGSVGIQANKPDGTLLIGATGFNTNQTYNLTLSENGIYSIYVWLGNGGTPGSLTTTLAVDAPPVPVSTNGDASTVSNQVGGQVSYFTFSATAGENLGLGFSNLSVAGYGTYTGNVGVTIYNPNGTTWMSSGCGAPQCNFNLWNAPQTGTYTVIVDTFGQNNETFSATVTLSDSLALTLPETDSPTTMNLQRFGQNGIYTFVGTAGQQVALQFAVSNGGSIGIQVNNPDGSTLIGGTGINATQTYNLTLPQNGAYLIYVWPGNGGTPGSVMTTLAVDPEPLSITVDGGNSSPVADAIGGQYAYATFTANIGENLGIGLSDIVVNGDSYLCVDVYDPLHNLVAGGNCYTGSNAPPTTIGFHLSNITMPGTYTVMVLPREPNVTFSTEFAVSDDLVETLPGDGTPTAMSINQVGQSGWFNFEGTSGQSPTLQISGLVQSQSGQGVALTVYNPDGAVLLPTTNIPGSSANFELNLNQTGTYQAFFSPSGGETFSLTARLRPDVPVGGPALLLHGHGAQGGQTFVDSSAFNNSIFVSGSGSQVFTDTAQALFGSSSIEFGGGGSSASLQVLSNIQNLSFDDSVNSSWTVEVAVFPTSVPGSSLPAVIFSKGALYGSYNGVFMSGLTMSGGNAVTFMGIGPTHSGGSSSAQLILGSTPIPMNQWTRLAWVRAGNTLYGYVNGNLDWTATKSVSMTDVSTSGSISANSPDAFWIGNFANAPGCCNYQGWLEEARVTMGQALYTASYTPASAPFPNP